MGNTVFFWVKRLMERWYLLITEKFLFWTFWWCEIRSFFESRSWWKDDIYLLLKSSCLKLSGDGKYGSFFESRSWWKDDIYWLLRSSHFELFGDGKRGLFLSQKVDGKTILLGLLELSMIFHDLGNMAFRAVTKKLDIVFFEETCA